VKNVEERIMENKAVAYIPRISFLTTEQASLRLYI